MAIEVREKYRGKRRARGTNSWAEIAFIAFGELGDTIDQAELAIVANAPQDHADLPIEGIGLLEEIHDDDGEPQPVWEATVRYGLQSRDVPFPEPGTVRTSFRTTGGTSNIKKSINTRHSYYKSSVDGTQYDRIDSPFDGLINASGPGEPAQGTEIIVPIFDWTRTLTIAASDMTDAYVRKLFLLTGTTNLKQWKGLQRGEGLFYGVEGNQRVDNAWDVTFNVGGQPNATELEYGDFVIEKRGWDYVWVYEIPEEVELTEDGDRKILGLKTEFVMVEQVYREADWIGLGLGV